MDFNYPIKSLVAKLVKEILPGLEGKKNIKVEVDGQIDIKKLS